MASHYILDGRVRLNQRPETKRWSCETRFNGQKLRKSSGEDNLGAAMKVAEDWYFQVRSGDTKASPVKAGKISGIPSFTEAADLFFDEYQTLTQGERNPRYVSDHKARLKNHLLPFFGDDLISEVTETGFKSHFFAQQGRPLSKAKIIAKVRMWLDESAQSDQWKGYVEKNKQGELF